MLSERSDSHRQRMSHSVEPEMGRKTTTTFLKKGDKSRVYDPQEAIKMQKKKSAEYKPIAPEDLPSYK